MACCKVIHESRENFNSCRPNNCRLWHNFPFARQGRGGSRVLIYVFQPGLDNFWHPNRGCWCCCVWRGNDFDVFTTAIVVTQSIILLSPSRSDLKSICSFIWLLLFASNYTTIVLDQRIWFHACLSSGNVNYTASNL